VFAESFLNIVVDGTARASWIIPPARAINSGKERIMLLLKRKESEQIMIGDNVIVTVSEIRGNRVQLAISAPHNVRIMRAELLPNVGGIDAPQASQVLAE